MVLVSEVMILTGEVVLGGMKSHVLEQPKVEVVFCLDTTGSMSGLIEGAKQKIWAIANQIVKGKPTPKLSIGLVGYRDRGDEYITKVCPLTNDLDAVFENLMSFQAGGGGDTPEHVNRALYDAVHRIKWSNNPMTFKLIFLVGDCPPHMDYQDGYDYRKSCEDAVKQGIIINTVQCGNYAETVKFWQEIAALGEGEYTRIEQSGGMRVIETPFDKELAKLNSRLEGTIVAFGSIKEREKAGARLDAVRRMASTIAAERAAYKCAEEKMSAYDLIDALRNNRVKLEEIEDEKLPDEMRKMSLQERKDYLAEKEKERRELKVRIDELSQKRAAYISAKLKENPDEDAFDRVVQKLIAKQAERKGIVYH